ncbi:MAG: winged helix-turn-helix domain-containing protein [Conexivisphaerales archaeon]
MLRRSRLEVLVDIMKVIAEEREIRRTRVMYRANLAWKVLKESLDFLKKNNIIQERETSAGIVISLTQQGYSVLSRYTEIEAVFSPIAPVAYPQPRQNTIFT